MFVKNVATRVNFRLSCSKVINLLTSLESNNLRISVANCKSELGFLFNSICQELKTIEYGINLQTCEYWRFDKPARASVLNMVSSTGYYGCFKCLQRDGGTVQTYPFNEENPDGPKRDSNLHKINIKNASNREESYGVKGECILSNLKYFNPINNTLIDAMHSIFYGVIKSLFVYWFDSPDRMKFSMKKYIFSLNKRLLGIRPPSFISNAPRSLYDLKNWRCRDFMNIESEKNRSK
ncbi:hypothetical protein BpHYR1_028817 [Brachionus plicatilis]|uniref:Uncharacterized protein n=1 Tax=Brachionus plicatilis TaxID=10195 RepID=A0A3M7SE94_BRAPC|nr:hypothetical protein BpHYR1_028817 [Brachionus plicatilis]